MNESIRTPVAREMTKLGKTAEELGYQDAMRQVLRSMQRRLKALEDECKTGDEGKQRELRVRMSEVEHLIQIVESLHR